MNRAEKFKDQNDKLWIEILEYIEYLLSRLQGTDLSEEDIKAYTILDDMDTGHVGVFYITKVNDAGVLFGTLDDDEEEIPFETMTNEALIQLAEELEEYVDV